MIKNLIFDIGGVLLTDEDDPFLKNPDLEKNLGVSRDEISIAWHKYWPAIEIAKIGEDEFISLFLEELKIESSEKKINEIKTIWRSETKALPAYELLPLFAKDFTLFSLTNTGKDWFEYRITHFGLDKYFKLIIASCVEKVSKPQDEIFKILINRANIIPQESVFIDDRNHNIEASQKFGFKTILFKKKDQLVNDLEVFEVKI